MDYDNWIKSVKETVDFATLSQLFDLFSTTLAESKKLDYFDVKKIVGAFRHGFESVEDDTLVKILNATSNLIEFGEHDIELYIQPLLPFMVLNLLDYKLAIKKAAKQCINTFVKKTRNIDEVIKMFIEKGLLSTSFNVRAKAVGCFIDLLAIDKNQWKNDKDTLFVVLRKGIEVVIGYYGNTSDIQLKDECRKCLVGFIKRKKFELLLTSLSTPDREVVEKLNRDYVQNRTIKEDQIASDEEKEAVISFKLGRLSKARLEAAGRAPDELKETFIDYEKFFHSNSLEFFQVRDGLVFGLFKKETFEDSFKLDADWKVRYLSLEEMYLNLAEHKGPLRQDQQWNITKFVYIQLNCGMKIEFLEKVKSSKRLNYLLSLDDHMTGWDKLEGHVKGTKYRRPKRGLNLKDKDKKELPELSIQSTNAPKIDVILLLMAQRVISYRSTLLLEPILHLLCLSTISVRKMAFDMLANLQRLLSSKKKTLLTLYLEALKFPNWMLRCETLKLICLAIYQTHDNLGRTAEEIIQPILPLLDDDATKVKLLAVDCLVLVSRLWSSPRLQELLSETLERDTYEFILDRIDDEEYRPIDNIIIIDKREKKSVYQDNGFMKDIVEKDDLFQGIVKDKFGKDWFEEGADGGEGKEGEERKERRRKIEERKKRREERERKKKEQELEEIESLEESEIAIEGQSSTKKSLKSSLKGSKNKSKAEDASAVSQRTKKGESIIISSTPPDTPPRPSKAKMVIPEGLDNRKKLKGDHIAKVMSLNAEEYKNYRGRDNGFVYEDPNKDKRLTNEEMLSNAVKQYMGERDYDGKFNPSDETGNDPEYDRYKKVFEVPKDAKIFEKFRKKKEEEHKKENQDNLWKPPPPEVNEKVPYIDFEHLRPLKDPEHFVNHFDEICDEAKGDPSLILEVMTDCRKLLKFNKEMMFDFNFSIPNMIDFICEHMQDDDETAMTSLVFIRELSYHFKKVLDGKLETLLGALYSLHSKTANKSLRQEALYTLRTLSKYSSDLKFMYYILMMPEQMFSKYRLANSYCLSFILSKENLNILVLEEELLEKLTRLAADLFSDAHQKIQDLGEEIEVSIFQRFIDRKKADIYLKMIKIQLKPKKAEQILRFLKLNFENIEEIVSLAQKMRDLDVEDFRARGKTKIREKEALREQRERGTNGPVYGGQYKFEDQQTQMPPSNPSNRFGIGGEKDSLNTSMSYTKLRRNNYFGLDDNFRNEASGFGGATNRESGQKESMFRRSGQSLLSLHAYKPNKDEFSVRKPGSQGRNSHRATSNGGILLGNRNHKEQETLMKQIHELINN